MGDWIDQGRGPMVQVLMGVFNGASFLPAQLYSLATQRDAHWRLICADDHSTDHSAEILRSFARRHPGRVRVHSGPGRGFVANYLMLLAGLSIDDGHYVALADQDDVWLAGKLSRASRALDRVPPDVPALYTARRWIWTPEKDRTYAEQRRGIPAFRNALVENIAPGNTIVLNTAAAVLARQAAPLAEGVFAHDWWLYQLITGAGGRVICDPAYVVLYRQHDRNVIGGRRGAFAMITRKRAVLGGTYQARITAQTSGLHRCREFLCPSARAELDGFLSARDRTAPGRLCAMAALGPYRHNFWSTVGFWGAIALGKV
ncbi:glycosyltransferase [Roseovarius aestuarii]|nr:glycosyltransferase [Roseovarius aestuarii]